MLTAPWQLYLPATAHAGSYIKLYTKSYTGVLAELLLQLLARLCGEGQADSHKRIRYTTHP